MNCLKKFKVLAIPFLFFLGNLSNAAPWQAHEKNFIFFKAGKVVSRTSIEGIVTYHYKDGKLKEVRRPGKLAQYFYVNDQLDRIVHLDGRVDRAVYTDGKLVGFESNRARGLVPARIVNGNVAVPDEPRMELMLTDGGGQACQINAEGEVEICSDWGGGGGGGGGGGSYDPAPPPPEDGGGSPGGGGIGAGGGGSSDPDDPLGGKTIAQINCEATVMRGYYAFATECSKRPTLRAQALCHEANSDLMAEGLYKCAQDYGKKIVVMLS